MADQHHTSQAGGDESDRPLLSDEHERDDHHTSNQQTPAPQDDGDANENTPLLSGDDNDGARNDLDQADAPSLSWWSRIRPSASKEKLKSRWATILSLVFLCLAIIAILCVGFAMPEAMQEYAEQAAVFKPTNLSIDSFTTEGINARVQGEFYFEGSRVEKKPVRDLGRFGTWIARKVETGKTTVAVSMPEYDVELGTVDIPPIVVSVRDGERTHIDVVANITPGEVDGLRHIADEWLKGRLGQLRLQGKANVGLKSGIFSFGTQAIVKTLTFQDDQVPQVPEYDISRLNVHELELPDVGKVMSADVKISAYNKYPVFFSVPPLAFDILIPGCSSDGPHLLLANATTGEVIIEPDTNVEVAAQGIIRHLAPPLVSACPGSSLSPLDKMLGDYINGSQATLYVRGSENPSLDTPQWITDIIKSFTVAVPFTGHSMGKLIRNFSMEDTHFSMPNPLADPNTPEAQPRVSTTIEVLANLPGEMNFPINVSRVRATADVLYEDKKFGVIDLQKWQHAKSHRVEAHKGVPALLAVEAKLENVPLSITDQAVFSDVISEMLFGNRLTLDVKALVDIEIASILGVFAVREVPGQGKVPLQPLLKNGTLGSISPDISKLSIVSTAPSSITLQASVDLTNPTKYTAHVPYVNVHILNNGTILGNATAEDLEIVAGRNKAIAITATWDPIELGGKAGANASRALLSGYISGRNTTLSFRTHAGSLPFLPQIGEALSRFEIKIAAPRLTPPKKPGAPDDDDKPKDRPHFIDEATMHLVTSSADFTLLSPLRKDTIFLNFVNATALYNHTDPVGQITYDLPIAIPPGVTKTPRLPVDWSLGGVGYDAVKEALGGTLKLGAKAVIDIQIGRWRQTLDFEGDGIGAHIQL